MPTVVIVSGGWRAQPCATDHALGVLPRSDSLVRRVPQGSGLRRWAGDPPRPPQVRLPSGGRGACPPHRPCIPPARVTDMSAGVPLMPAVDPAAVVATGRLSSSVFESGALPPVASHQEATGGGFWTIRKVRSRSRTSNPRPIRLLRRRCSRLMWPIVRSQVRLCASRSAPAALARPPACLAWPPPPMPPSPPSRAVATAPRGPRRRLSCPKLPAVESYFVRVNAHVLVWPVRYVRCPPAGRGHR